LTAEQAGQAAIAVICANGNANVKYGAVVDCLKPGDIVQTGSLFPTVPELGPDRSGASGEKAAELETPSRINSAVAADGAALHSPAGLIERQPFGQSSR
jgi:hypothetical protein